MRLKPVSVQLLKGMKRKKGIEMPVCVCFRWIGHARFHFMNDQVVMFSPFRHQRYKKYFTKVFDCLHDLKINKK